MPHFRSAGHIMTIPGAILFLCCLLMYSCSAPPREVSTPVELPDNFSRSGSSRQKPRWWQAFGDADLERLVELALDDNFDLKKAWARLDEAAATARIEGADQYPQLDASAEGSRTARERSRRDDENDTELSLGLQAQYEVDLWGRISSEREAARLAREATRQELHAAAISVSAAVADAWYGLIEQRLRRDILKQQLGTNRQYLQLVTGRFRNGRAPATDVLRQRKLVESTRNDLSKTRRDIRNLRHRLAVVTGQVPARAELPQSTELPELPPLPDTGVPSEWIQQRPDVQSAYLEVQSADSALAAAIANRYPSFTIKSSITSAATRPSALLEEWVADIAGSAAVALVDGNRLDARVDRARAENERLLYEFGQTVLESVQEVEDALSDEESQKESVRRIRRELALTEQTLQQLSLRYRRGSVEYTEVLEQLREMHSYQLELVGARTRLVRKRVELYRRLGGGWELERSQ
ncbi:MAG: efflux transporter outer membrane subunit [Planctomycetota bacterium]